MRLDESSIEVAYRPVFLNRPSFPNCDGEPGRGGWGLAVLSQPSSAPTFYKIPVERPQIPIIQEGGHEPQVMFEDILKKPAPRYTILEPETRRK